MSRTREFALVALGGVVGAAIRWIVAEALPRDVGGFPWATLSVNITGCLLIGLAARRLVPGTAVWLALVVGMLGGLTTFSTFAVETRSLVDAGESGTALIYMASTLAIGLAATEIARWKPEHP